MGPHIASALATLLPIVAVVYWRRASKGARLCIAGGALMAVLFNLPSVFVWKAEQMHLVAAGGSLLLAGSILAILDAAERLLDELRLDTPQWRYSPIRLPDTSRTLGGMKRVRIVTSGVWYPARIIPQSNDPRALGVQIGEIALR